MRRELVAEVRPERTGWRDQSLSERHRRWGFGLPAADLDFLLIEHDKGQPCALIEYKHECSPPQYVGHPSYQALARLGDRATLPALAVRYARDFSWWLVVPINDLARDLFPTRKRLSEAEWVQMLYRLRGHEMPIAKLNTFDAAV